MVNVIGDIASNDLCVGCGVCVAVCPDEIIKIRTDEHGEYKPYLKQACMRDCGLCYRVCPFGDGNPDEDAIGKEKYGSTPRILHDMAVGYYLESYVGHVASELRRERSASGGLATWLLTTLLLKNHIDEAICVTPSNEPDTLFKYSTMKNVKEIESSSGSAYYPVQLSDVLSYVMSKPGRYAITALPCFAKGIRLAQSRNKVLRERIVCIIGITCGQMKNKQYTGYIAALSGVYGQLTKVHYRGKANDRSASNYYFSCEDMDGKTGKRFWDEGISEAWHSRCFTLNACNYCDDIFAECADVVCMDAWLPEYSSDWRGTSFALVRSPRLNNLIEDGVKTGELIVASMLVDRIVQSQNELVRFKRQEISTRLWVAKKEGEVVPIKRVHARRCFDPLVIKKTGLLRTMQEQSKVTTPETSDERRLALARLSDSMIAKLGCLHLVQKILIITRAPSVIVGKIRNP